MSQRISKACQECRERKIRCTGGDPCKTCRIYERGCIYRSQIRVRRNYNQPKETGINGVSPTASRTTTTGRSPETGQTAELGVDEVEVYSSVSATRPTELRGTMQLYYGAASNLAFVQQLQRSLTADSSFRSSPKETSVSDHGLDLMKQAAFFWGTPTALHQLPREHRGASDLAAIDLDLADKFLEAFFEKIHPMASFISQEDTRSTLQSFRADSRNTMPDRGKYGVFLAVLALGAQCTEYVQNGENLFSKARSEASIFEEVVNLEGVQLLFLLATYQLTIGRPDSSYLLLGGAIRKAFTMGLNKKNASGKEREASYENEQRRRTTIWSVYALESILATIVGRIGLIDASQIACPLPENQSFLNALVQLLQITVQSAKLLYNEDQPRVTELWKSGRAINTQLRQYAEHHSIAFASPPDVASRDFRESLYLHQIYFHTIIITFRRFLVISSSRQAQRQREQTSSFDTETSNLLGDDMWLREACRLAIDAAKDQISFSLKMVHTVDASRGIRVQASYVKNACVILLYDILSKRTAYWENIKYLRAGLEVMSLLVPGEPVTSAASSLEQIIQVVGQRIGISDSEGDHSNQDSSSHFSHDNTAPAEPDPQSFLGPAHLGDDTQFGIIGDASTPASTEYFNTILPLGEWDYNIFTNGFLDFRE